MTDFMFCRKMTTFKPKLEDRLRLGSKNKQTCFVLLSACTIFIAVLKL